MIIYGLKRKQQKWENFSKAIGKTKKSYINAREKNHRPFSRRQEDGRDKLKF